MLLVITHDFGIFKPRAKRIPDSISIDITDLDIGDSFHVEDLQLDEDIEVPADVNFTILTILSTKAEEAEEEEGEEGEEGEVSEGAETTEDSAGE